MRRWISTAIYLVFPMFTAQAIPLEAFNSTPEFLILPKLFKGQRLFFSQNVYGSYKINYMSIVHRQINVFFE